MSNVADRPISGPGKTGPGNYSLTEILSQPSCWQACLDELDRSRVPREIAAAFSDADEWLFIGCGSSYYIAMAAAFSWSAITGTRARAIPASELLLFPDLTLTGAGKTAAVAISRSGQTSEVLQAAKLLEQEKNIRVIAVTCAADQPLSQIASHTLALLPADEKSTVMTRSFTSMVIGLQYLASVIADGRAFAASLRKLPSAAQKVLDTLHPRIRDFVQSRQFADYIYLGQGPFFGLACECALKVTEMSVSYAQSFHTLEFRHGPKSVVAPETLVMFLLSQTGFEAECEVLGEIKTLGGTTLAVANRAGASARASSDLLVEFDFDGPELVRLAPFMLAGQLIGLYTGLKKGLDPDNPRNLTRVVILDNDDASGKPEHAAL